MPEGVPLAEAVLADLARHVRLDAEQLQVLRERIFAVVNYQAVVGVLGKTGAGKSALCNALFGQDEVEVSAVDACTRAPQELTLAYRQGKGIALIDMPGVGESQARDVEYAAMYQDMLPELDLILWVIKADDRALSVDERFYNDVVRPYAARAGIPVLFVINQVDKIEPSHEWSWQQQQPGPTQAGSIHAKVLRVSQHFGVSPEQICTVSATWGFGLIGLLDTLIRTLPQERRWGLLREARSEHVSDQAREDAEQGLWDTVKQAVTELLKDSAALIIDGLAALAKRLFRRL
ncbi:hypothetical protein BJP62_03910 [Jeongeupia sp. USM3]|nr:hypothetical protein BJP62_03910 [Jeongeupia sp. USM3]